MTADAWVRLVVARRRAVVAVLALLAAAAIAVLPRAEPSADIVRMFLGDSEEAQSLRFAEERFGSEEPVVLAAPHPAPTSDAALAALARLETTLRDDPAVARVVTLASLPRVADDGTGALAITTWADALRATPPPARAALLRDPDVRGFVADDAVFAIVLLRDDARALSPVVQAALPDRLRAAAVAAGLAADPSSVRLLGFSVAVAALLHTVGDVARTLLPLTAIALAALMLLLYRRAWPMLLAVAVASLASLWATAVAILIDGRMTILQAAAPVLIGVLSLSDTVFFIDAYARARRAGDAPADAAARALREVLRAVVLTTLSTVLSALSLALVPSPAIRTLGFTLAGGVAAALGLVLVLGPLVAGAGAVALPPAGRRVDAWLGALVDACLRLALGRPRTVVAVAAALTIASLAALPALRVETDWAARYPDAHPLAESRRFVVDRVGAWQTLDLLVEVEPGRALSAALLADLARLERKITARPDVVGVASPATIVGRGAAALAGVPGTRLPADDDGVEQVVFLLGAAGGDALAGLVDAQRAAVRVRVRVATDGIMATASVADELAALARAELPTARAVRAGGVDALLGRFTTDILRAQVRSLGLVAIAMIVVLAVGLRSLRPSLVALWPNVLPVTLFLGALTLPGHHFDSDYLVVAIVGLGIAVDDTIHFLTRLRHELLVARRPVRAAVRATAAAVGPSMAKTTVVLTLGLAPVLASDFLSVRMYFTQLSRVLVGALAADLLLVPALVVLGWIRFPGQTWQDADSRSTE